MKKAQNKNTFNSRLSNSNSQDRSASMVKEFKDITNQKEMKENIMNHHKNRENKENRENRQNLRYNSIVANLNRKTISNCYDKVKLLQVTKPL